MVAQNNSGNGNNISIISIINIAVNIATIVTLYMAHNIILVICWQHNVIRNKLHP